MWLGPSLAGSLYKESSLFYRRDHLLGAAYLKRNCSNIEFVDLILASSWARNSVRVLDVSIKHSRQDSCKEEAAEDALKVNAALPPAAALEAAGDRLL